MLYFFFFQAEDGIRDIGVTGVQTCALPIFPMMFFSINAYGLDAAASIPGFPADSYLDFAFAFPLIQASLFGAITAGADLAGDIESGFLDRKSTRLNSSHANISYAVFCLKKKREEHSS